MARRSLVVPIADLRRHPASRRHVTVSAEVDGLATSAAAVPAGDALGVDLELEALASDLTATGTITVPWQGECRRCLATVHGEIVAEVREVFERHPVEGETYPLGDDEVDLEPMVRDAALLALPLAPLCGVDCRGQAPESFPVVPAEAEAEAEAVEDEGEGEGEGEGDAVGGDPRWAALDALRFDPPDEAR